MLGREPLFALFATSFTFIDDSGEIVVVWEHLGMLDRPDYVRSWEWKKAWYETNELREGETLFTTREINGLDMEAIAEIAREVRRALD